MASSAAVTVDECLGELDHARRAQLEPVYRLLLAAQKRHNALYPMGLYTDTARTMVPQHRA